MTTTEILNTPYGDIDVKVTYHDEHKYTPDGGFMTGYYSVIDNILPLFDKEDETQFIEDVSLYIDNNWQDCISELAEKLNL